MSKHIIQGTARNFKREVLESPIPVLVDYWAPWCGPCRMIAPLLEEFGARYAGKVKVVKVNVDEEKELGATFRIRSIPTLMAFYNGQTVGRMAGFGGREQLLSVFDEMSALSTRSSGAVV